MLRRRFVWTLTLATGCSGPRTEVELLPDFGQLPEFKLIRHSGGPFTRDALRGKVWVLDFIFTRCKAVCPRMTSEMRKLQERVVHLPQVGLLSVSIDPEFDTPRVLMEFATRHKADPVRWTFLTGDRQMVRMLQVKMERHLDPEEIVFHSKHFYLVDSDGFVRGEYPITIEGKMEELMADIRKLLATPARPEPGTTL